jgi:hypothetical protein
MEIAMTSLFLGVLVTGAVLQTPAPPPAAEPGGPGQSAPIVSGVDEPPQLSAPFRNLFAKAANEARRNEQMRQAIAHLEAARALPRGGVAGAPPKVVCGMVVLPADPSVDAKMIQRPKDSTTTMHIRKIPPAACAE